MDAIVEHREPQNRPLTEPRARVGLLIPSVNRMSEPQFNHFAPPGLAVHVARARITGQWRKPAVEMKDEIARAVALRFATAGPTSSSPTAPIHPCARDAPANARASTSCARPPASRRWRP